MKRWKKRVLMAAAAMLVLILLAMAAAPLFVLPMFLGQRYELPLYDAGDFGVDEQTMTLMTDDGLALGRGMWRRGTPRRPREA